MNTDLKLMNQTSNLDFRCAKVEQQTYREAGRPQVIQALGNMDIIQSLNRLQLHQDFLLH
jgi:hypothetical protein